MAANLRALNRDIQALLSERCSWSTLEELFTAPWGFGIPATPLQRAICRVLEGRPIADASTANVARAMGIDVLPHTLPTPKELFVLAGIRGGKSLLAAATAINASQRCDLSMLAKGEVPRYSIVSLSMDLARVAFGHLVGTVMRSERLKRLLWKEPTADTLTLKHPSGRPVELRVVAGARAGASLAARWSIGVCFDEAPKMLGSEEGVVNLDDARANVVGRLLPGAQMLCIGSPWAPFGPVYDMVQEHFGKPSERCIVVRAPGPELNPVWWTPERIADLEKNDPDAYQTDVLAEFRSPEENIFTEAILNQCIRKEPKQLSPAQRQSYVACIDPATRTNAWTLVVMTREGRRKRVVLNRQWVPKPGEPLKAREVLRDIAELVSPYRVSTLLSDQWGADLIDEHARDVGLSVISETWSDKMRTDHYLAMRRDMVDGGLEIMNDAELLTDLKRVKKITTASGVSIRLPQTGDGRHCDYAPAIVRAHATWIADVGGIPKTRDQIIQAETERMVKALRGEEPDDFDY